MLGKYKEMLYTYSIFKNCITISTIYMLILSVEPVDTISYKQFATS